MLGEICETEIELQLFVILRKNASTIIEYSPCMKGEFVELKGEEGKEGGGGEEGEERRGWEAEVLPIASCMAAEGERRAVGSNWGREEFRGCEVLGLKIVPDFELCPKEVRRRCA